MKHKTQVRVESQVGFPATSMDFVHVNSKILQLIPADVVPRNKTTQLFASRFFKQSPLKHNLDLFHLFYNNLHFNVQNLLIYPQTKLKPTTIYFRHNHSLQFVVFATEQGHTEHKTIFASWMCPTNVHWSMSFATLFVLT